MAALSADDCPSSFPSGAPTAAAPLPPVIPGARVQAPRPRRPTWRLIYFALAGFNLAIVLLGLYVNHHLTGIYTGSVAIDQEWSERVQRYDQLHRLARTVNAAAHHDADARDAAAQSRAMGDARDAFTLRMAEAREDLAQRVAPEVAARLLNDLAMIQTAVDGLAAEARVTVSLGRRLEPNQASARRAALDRKYTTVSSAFGLLDEHVRDVQDSLFRHQRDAANAARRFEWAIGLLILLMVGGTASYGQYLSKQAVNRARELEDDLRLRENERFLATLICNLPGMVYRSKSDPDWTMEFASDGCYELTGYRRFELEQNRAVSYGDLVHHADRERLWAKCQASLDARKPCNNEYRIVNKAGEITWVWERAQGIYSPDGALLGIEGYITDITERKRAEKALQKNERRLADSQRIAHLGSWELELGNNVLWWSDEVYRIFEMDPQTFGASYETFLDTVHPDDREFVNRAYTESVQTRTPYDIVHRLLMKDGRVKYVNECCETEYGMDGKPMRSIGTVRDVTERMQTEKTIQSLAYYDPLTTLPNRALLHDRLTQAIQAGQHQHKPLAFLLLDLDRFKDINNTLGHHHGDLILQQMGPRLQGLLRQFDMVARLGGDEFAILLPGTDAEGAVRVVNKLQQALAAPFLVDGLTITVEASIGIAVSPDHGTTADLIIQRANVAMYHAKEAGGGHTVYSPEHDHYNPRRLALMTELRYAIEHDELVLYYQPKIDLKTGCVIGVEALVRWRHPNRGLITPDEFIPLAERTGLIKPLTLWVLTAALHQSRTWQRAGLRLSVAVNLSARNLQDPELPDQIEDMLTRSGTPPNQLELEITESTIMADPPRALEVLTRLHHMRIPLAIDDFGTGYSSLGYLRKLPVSAIKIDKSFVKNMVADDGDAVIVRSTIELAHNLGLLVVAEGVETQYIWDRLASLGCDAAQGYYMSAPMPAATLTRWFHESSWQVAKIADDGHPEAA